MPTHGPKTRIASLGVGATLGTLVVLSAEPAGAYDAEVTASADAQWYALQAPWSGAELVRRRYTHTLGLSVYRIGQDDPKAPEVFFRSRMRLDADFGQLDVERNPARDSTFVGGLEQGPVDVMYAYLEGRELSGGWLGFRLGRQYVSDALGWWSFDGAQVSVTTPVYLRIEAYGGFEQRGLSPWLGTRRFEAGGVWRGDRTGLEVGQNPEFLEESRPAPAIGVAIESAGTHWLHSRLTYRRVINRDVVYLSMIPDASGRWSMLAGNRISSERIGYAVRADTPSLGGVHGRVVYDLYTNRWSQYGAGIDWYTADRLTLGADYDYSEASFDGDSIFNWFPHSGIGSVLGRAEVAVSRQLDVTASGGIKHFRTHGDPERYAGLDVTDPRTIVNALNTPIDQSESRTEIDPLANVNGVYRWNDGSFGVGARGELGESGHTAGMDGTLRQEFSGGFYDTLAMLSVYDWSDSLRPTRDATSLTYVIGGGIKPLGTLASVGRIGVEWEHTVNRLVGQRFRLLATLDLMVLR
jgi:hypothetical protein